ncbi:MAG: hypothetical protein Q9195_001427 [Heterodermia aff. obscurata]
MNSAIHQNNRLLLDDAFFFLALITLIAGTSTTYVDIPYIYLQEDVQAGIRMPPPDFIQQLLRSVKIQDAAVVLLSSTLLSVKLSFLFFFRQLLLKCVTPSALSRENASLKAVTILDLLSDLLILTIPILLLWGVKISLRRKLALGTILCLSVFTMLICIIRISGGNTVNGQIDTAWVIFWLQVEAAVAVIIVSVTAYRMLFVAENPQYRDSPPQQQIIASSSSSRARVWNRARTTTRSNGLPGIPAPTLSGFRDLVRRSGGDKEAYTARSDDSEFVPLSDLDDKRAGINRQDVNFV